MKVTVDVDCTPEEARRFMGLPDLSPVHQAYVDRMQKAVSEAFTPDSVVELMKQWGPMSEAGINLWRQMFDPTASE